MADDLRSLPDAGLYEEDFFLWSERQARLIREHADALAELGLDVAHLEEEVGDLGRAELNQVLGLTRHIVEHLYKLAWSRASDPRPGWIREILVARSNIEDRITPTLRRKVEERLDVLHGQAARIAALSFATHEPDTPTDDTLRWTLPEILGEAGDPLDAA